MTKQQASKAFKIAMDMSIDLSNVDDSNLFGCALPEFEPINTTLEAVAKLMRYQALMFNGKFDMNEINEVIRIGKRRFIILNGN